MQQEQSEEYKNTKTLWAKTKTVGYSGIAVGTLCCVALIILGAHLLTSNNGETHSLDNVRTNYENFATEMHNSAEKQFENAFYRAKGGVILAFILVTIVYQILYGSVPAAGTYLGSSKYLPRALADMAVGSAGGIISTICVLGIRGGLDNIRNHKLVIVIVGIVMGLFNISMESSGFNRYLSASDIDAGIGPYSEIDKTNNNSNISLTIFKDIETGGDPFVTSMTYTASILLLLVVLQSIIVMFIATGIGFNNPDNQICSPNSSIRYYLGSDASCTKCILLFLFELLVIIGGINAIPAYLSPWIRGETYTSKSFIVATLTALAGMILDVMFQYNGKLNTNNA